MNKKIISVPKGIRFLGEWSDFTLPNHPCIINKKLTGCGFTEYVIRGNFNAVWISPRKVLLENKLAQHPGEIYYAENTSCEDLQVDKDINKDKLSKERIDTGVNKIKYFQDLKNAIVEFDLSKRPVKIEVTYDSFRLVREVLEELGRQDQFYYIVDEFQSVFTDVIFKPNTEIEFVSALEGLNRVSYVSATPMMEEYLDEVDEFKDLPYYELDWESEDQSRIIKPEIIANSCRNINEVAKRYITDHRNGKYALKPRLDSSGNPIEIVEARTLNFYINSVKNICDIIRQNKLMPEEVNVICSDTSENRAKIREAFRQVFKSKEISSKLLPKLDEVIGKIPLKGEPDKSYSLITKTAYLGSDMYSDCARTIVMSDSGIECMTVDVTLDLPQILGRQRNDRNPWKYSAEVWFKLGNGCGEISEEESNRRMEAKIHKSNDILLTHSFSPTVSSKHTHSEMCLIIARTQNYRENYISVNQHKGGDMFPVFNKLALLAEKRAFEIQKKDYKDRFSVFNAINKSIGGLEATAEVQEFLDKFFWFSTFIDRMCFLCENINNYEEVKDQILKSIPSDFSSFYYSLGLDFIKSVGYQRSKLVQKLKLTGGKIQPASEEEIKNTIYNKFSEGYKYSKAEVKQILGETYNSLGITKTAKSNDLEEWFEVRPCKITNNETGKRDHAIEIIKRK